MKKLQSLLLLSYHEQKELADSLEQCYDCSQAAPIPSPLCAVLHMDLVLILGTKCPELTWLMEELCVLRP